LGGVVVDVLGDQYRWLWLFSAFFMALATGTMSALGKEQARQMAANPPGKGI
jgi:hypothetical protein